MIDLAKLVENEWWIVCGLMSTDRFITFCRDRGLETSRHQLEHFEKQGLFYPLMRVEFPPIAIKVRYSPDRATCEDLGILESGEAWEGETREEYSSFEFTREFAQDWLDHGILWDPKGRVFESWSTFFAEDRRVESYYSMFQCFSLYHLQQSLSVRICPEAWLNCEPAQIAQTVERIAEWAKGVVSTAPKAGNLWDAAGDLCQAISNRYYPEAQSDRRTRTVSYSGLYQDWSWQHYRSNWDPAAVLGLLAVSSEEVKKLQELTASEARWIDPLADWYSLVRFVSVEQRARLKGKALLAQGIYDREEMLRLFYKDLTAGFGPS